MCGVEENGDACGLAVEGGGDMKEGALGEVNYRAVWDWAAGVEGTNAAAVLGGIGEAESVWRRHIALYRS